MELTIEEALQQGILAHKAGKLEEAERLYRAIIGSVPTHSDANHNLGVLAVGVGKVDTALPYFKTALEANPNHGQYWISYIDALIKLGRIDDARKVLEQGKAGGLSGDAVTELESRLSGYDINKFVKAYNNFEYEDLFKWAQEFLKKYPLNPKIYEMLAKAYGELGRNADAELTYRQLIILVPNNANFYNDFGVIRSNQLAIDYLMDLKKAVYLNPLLNNSYNNQGIYFYQKRNYLISLDKYKKAILLSPNRNESYNNLATSQTELGRIAVGGINLLRALILQPKYKEAIENLINIQVQQSNYQKLEFLISSYVNSPVWNNLTLRTSCLCLIFYFIKAEYKKAKYFLSEIEKGINTEKFFSLSEVNQNFVSTYYNYIGQLILRVPMYSSGKDTPIIYHIGESHCLSYAHHMITIKDKKHKVQPKVILGAKAWHLGSHVDNGYKSFFRELCHDIPSGSEVFLSFGEIDCRREEGIFDHCNKYNKSIKDVVVQTVSNYVKFVAVSRVAETCNLYFLGIPAPVLSVKNKLPISKEDHSIISVVRLFNAELKHYATRYGAKYLDIYSFTSNEYGISNGKFNCDDRHLSPKAIEQINKLLSDNN